jgi:hypothetical protein
LSKPELVENGSPQICGKRQLKLHQRKAQNRPTPIGIEPAQAGFVGFVVAISIAQPHKSEGSLKNNMVSTGSTNDNRWLSLSKPELVAPPLKIKKLSC